MPGQYRKEINNMDFLPDRIKKLKSYTVPQVSDGEIKLDAQENPYPVDEQVKKRVNKLLKDLSLNRYPDSSYRELRRLIGEYCVADADNILVGNGSDELILTVLMACGGSSCTVSFPHPTFVMYEILGKLIGVRTVRVNLDDGFKLPSRKILATNPDITFIAYPNNPTGNCFSRDKIMEIIEYSRGLVVVDEAYYEFSGKSFVGEIKHYENLVVLRTFSKAFSLAGIRAGYMVGNEKLIRQFRKVQLPYNLSIINQGILEIILQERERVLSSVRQLMKSRDRMFAELLDIEGINPYPSEANFILMKIKRLKRVLEVLEENKIKVREFDLPELKDYLRVTVGTEEENSNFINTLKKGL
jgi:histidinol-phosphate aminotransferase